jgi:hypothetical protein
MDPLPDIATNIIEAVTVYTISSLICCLRAGPVEILLAVGLPVVETNRGGPGIITILKRIT